MWAWSWRCGLRQPRASSYPWTGSAKPPSAHHCHQLQRQVSENRVPLWADDGTGAFSTWVICPCVTSNGTDQWGPKVRPPVWGALRGCPCPPAPQGLSWAPHARWASHPEDPRLPAYWGWGGADESGGEPLPHQGAMGASGCPAP